MFYLYFGCAVIFFTVLLLLMRTVQKTLNTENALTELNEALKKRNIAALDIVRMVKSRANSAELPLEEVRRCAKLTAVTEDISGKALNAGLLRDFLASLLHSLKDHPALSEDRDFVSACLDLRDSEYAIDAAAIKYNGYLFFMNKAKANPIVRPFIGLLKLPIREYFAVVQLDKLNPAKIKPDLRVSNLADEFVRALNKDFSLECPCGLEIHIPPDFSEKIIRCQLCGTLHDIPDKYERGAEAIIRSLPANSGIFPEHSGHEGGQTGKGWGILRCTCGKVTQLSPGFEASYVRCPDCGNRIVPNKIMSKTASA